MKKTFAILLTMLLAVMAAVPAFAAETYTLTINQPEEGHTYDVYQIFGGTLKEDAQSGTAILSNIVWGSSVVKEGEYDYASQLVAALKSDTETLSYVSGGATVTTSLSEVFASVANDADSAAAVAEILGSGVASMVVERFAEVVGQAVYTDGTFQNHSYLGDAAGTASYSETNSNYTLGGLEPGYYLVKDRDGTQNGGNGFYTKYILQVVRSVSINIKGDAVTVTKGICDTVDGPYGKAADFGVSDLAYFQWNGSLPENLAAYDTYTYRFTDTVSAGLIFNRLEQVYIADDAGNRVATLLDLKDEDAANDTLPAGITLTTGTVTRAANSRITLEFADLLTQYADLSADDHVIVRYSARMDANAPVGTAMTGSVYLEYANNPSGEGMGKTLEDFAHAFTYGLGVDKYELNNETHKLSGVTFYLYRVVDSVNQYAQVADGMITGWVADRTAAAVLTTDENGAISVNGLDVGSYYLEEIGTNDGYNLLAAPVEVIISAVISNEDTLQASAVADYAVDGVSQGANSVVGIPNAKGSTLPSTGGMGTTLFYVLGGILAVGAVILLITRKRMSE